MTQSRRSSPPPSCTDDSRTRTSRSSTSGRCPPTTGGDWGASLEAVTSREPSPFPPRGSRASTRSRSSGCCTRRTSFPVARSSSTGTSRGRVGVPEQAGRPGPRRVPNPGARLARLGGRPGASRRAPAELRAPRPSRMARAAPRGQARRKPLRQAASCSSTSISGFPRSTRRTIFPGRSISTRTSSRTRWAGTAARPDELDAALRGLGITHETTVDPLRPGHGRRRGREVAGPAGRADLGLPRRSDPALLRRPRRPRARRRLRRLGPIRQPAGDDASRADAGSVVRHVRSRSGPRSSSTSTRPSRSSPTRTAPPSSASGPGASTSAEVSGYNYIRPAGRIAGDVWGNCGSDAYHMQHYRNVDNTMRAYPEIAANWEEAGITPDKWVAFYCGTGWRASETWFYAYLMGWQRIAVYDGGWHEWSQRPGREPDRGRGARGRTSGVALERRCTDAAVARRTASRRAGAERATVA